MRLADGSRGADGRWHPSNPGDYREPVAHHGIWPWSVLDQGSKPWQIRKKWWTDFALKGMQLATLGASPSMIATGRHASHSGGVSVFDPVLAELLYQWWCPAGGVVIDPAAGGPVRGLVAAVMGRGYLGVDIRSEQIHANRSAGWPGGDGLADWQVGDGRAYGFPEADFAIGCPPYHNLERYRGGPSDLSGMRWGDFVDGHAEMVANAAAALRPDRFMAWVIGDVRDSKGHLRGLPSIAATHLREAGLAITNELVLVQPPGLRAKTTRPPWEACRTTTRRHQTVLVAVKGDRNAATQEVRRT